MAYSSKKTSHIEKFNGTDFPFWKKQVLIVLKVHKLERVTDGTLTCPIQEKGDGGLLILHDDRIPTKQEAIKEWNDKDLQAQNLLFSTTDPGIASLIISTRFHYYNLT